MPTTASISDSSYSSHNKPKITYRWPTTDSGSIANAYLSTITVSYDHIHQRFINPLGSMSTCSVKRGSCLVAGDRYLWTVPKNLACPRSRHTGTDELLVHYNSTGHVYRLEVKDLGVSIHHHIPCPISIHPCFPSTPLCDPGGLILLPLNCKRIGTLPQSPDEVSNKPFPSFAHFASTNAYFLNENQDLMTEALTRLGADMTYLECKLQALLATLYSLIGHLYPGPVLTKLLGRPAAGRKAGDVLLELSCTTINATILHNLQHGNFFASRPLVQFRDFNDTIRIGQIYPDGFVYHDVKHIEKYSPGRIMTFHIDSSFYLFQNYTLTHATHDVRKLSPSLPPINAKPENVDFAQFSALFSSPQQTFEDMSALLQSMTQSQLTHDKLYHFLQTDTDGSVQADFQHISSTLDNGLHNVFLQMISNITSPFFNGLISILFILALIWSVVLTVWFIRAYTPLLFHFVQSTFVSVRHRMKPSSVNAAETTATPHSSINATQVSATSAPPASDSRSDRLYPNLQE